MVVYYTKEDGRQEISDEDYQSLNADITGECRIDLHRLDGPAITWNNGHIAYFVNGKCHREDGPAVHYSSGKESWMIEDKLHRVDGPADIEPNEDGGFNCSYFLDGEWFDKEDYDELIQEVKSMPLALRLVDPRKWVREFEE